MRKKSVYEREPRKDDAGEAIMGFRRSDLQEAFFVPGTHAFRVWGYGTADPRDEVLRPGYFEAARALVRRGELIRVSIRPPEGAGVSAG